ncbi:MAG: hypothetical protein HOO98_10460 [Nitrospira sp.]|nr:hypothetical protein [Nitrospira sp.]
MTKRSPRFTAAALGLWLAGATLISAVSTQTSTLLVGTALAGLVGLARRRARFT